MRQLFLLGPEFGPGEEADEPVLVPKISRSRGRKNRNEPLVLPNWCQLCFRIPRTGRDHLCIHE
jgi:hypothetical protein